MLYGTHNDIPFALLIRFIPKDRFSEVSSATRGEIYIYFCWRTSVRLFVGRKGWALIHDGYDGRIKIWMCFLIVCAVIATRLPCLLSYGPWYYQTTDLKLRCSMRPCRTLIRRPATARRQVWYIECIRYSPHAQGTRPVTAGYAAVTYPRPRSGLTLSKNEGVGKCGIGKMGTNVSPFEYFRGNKNIDFTICEPLGPYTRSIPPL